jgi:hypothetical protein
MSYNMQASRVASEVRAQLPSLVTSAKQSAPAEEHAQIELAGQAMHFALDGIDDDHLVELQAYGANVPSVGTRTFFVSVATRAIKAKAETAKAQSVPWDPSQGPLGALKLTGAVDANGSATSSSSAASESGAARAG